MIIAGDWHGHLAWAKRVIDLTADIDSDKLIMQVGDFGIWPGKEGVKYLDGLSDYLVKNKVKLMFLPGNHEWWPQLNKWMLTVEPNEDGHREIRSNIFYTGKVNSWVWNNKKLAVVGGAISIDRRWRTEGKDYWSEEELSEDEFRQATKIGKVDYLFTHDCSDLNPFKIRLAHHASSALSREKFGLLGRKYLKPEYWFHGHYHTFDKYELRTDTGNVTVAWSLDADSEAARVPFLDHHVVQLSIEKGEVTEFDWKIRSRY